MRLRLAALVLSGLLALPPAGFSAAPPVDAPAIETASATSPTDACGTLAKADDELCTTWADLVSRLENPAVSHITLGGDITVDTFTGIALGHDVTVEMGSYSLTVADSFTTFGAGILRLEGEGAEKPLVSVTTGRFDPGTETHITARADGATALLLEGAPASFGPTSGSALYITADGKDAVALHATGITDPANTWVDAREFLYLSISAAQGTGLLCEDTFPVTLLFSSITAGKASAVCLGPLWVDGSTLAPAPGGPDTVVYDRVALWSGEQTGGNRYRYGVWTYVGEAPELGDSVSVGMVRLQGETWLDDSRHGSFPVRWSYDADALAQPGTTTLNAVPTLPHDGMAVINLKTGMEHHLPLHVVERGSPYLVGANRYGKDIELLLMEDLTEDAKFTLWSRAEGQAEWQAVEGVEFNWWCPRQLYLSGMGFTSGYEFKLEITSGELTGTTNTLGVPGGRAFFTDVADTPTLPEIPNSPGEPGNPEAPDDWTAPEIAPDGNAACASQRDLVWLCARQEVRRIVLTADITITRPAGAQAWESVVLDPAGPLEVEMGDHSIRVCHTLRLSSPITFTGNGDKQPLFILETEGNALAGEVEATIIARAAGAVAVHSVSSTWPLGCRPTRVVADGAGSVALLVSAAPQDADSALALTWTELSATGAGGVALHCTEALPVQLKYCNVAGAAASVVAPGGGEATGCTIAPKARAIVSQKAYANWGPVDQNRYRYGVWTLEGQAPKLPELLQSDIYREAGESFEYSSSESIGMEWDWDPEVLDAPGTYPLYATPSLPLKDTTITPMAHGKTYALELHVAARDTQYLTYAYKNRSLGLCTITVLMMHPPKAGTSFVLWVRAGNGKWQAHAPNDETLFYTAATGDESARLSLRVGDFSRDYAFKLETIGGTCTGMSNTILVPEGAAYYTGESGGDRDGGDRGDAGELPESSATPAQKDTTGVVAQAGQAGGEQAPEVHEDTIEAMPQDGVDLYETQALADDETPGAGGKTGNTLPSPMEHTESASTFARLPVLYVGGVILFAGGVALLYRRKRRATLSAVDSK